MERAGDSFAFLSAFRNRIDGESASRRRVATVGSSIGERKRFFNSLTPALERSKNVARRKSRSRITNVGRTFMFHGHPVAPPALSRAPLFSLSLSPSACDRHPRSVRDLGDNNRRYTKRLLSLKRGLVNHRAKSEERGNSFLPLSLCLFLSFFIFFIFFIFPPCRSLLKSPGC